MTYGLLKRAVEDLESVEDYLLLHFGPIVARTKIDSLFRTFSLLAEYPGMGQTRPDLTSKPVRFFSSPPFWIVYATRTPITIHRVYHARRDLARLTP